MSCDAKEGISFYLNSTFCSLQYTQLFDLGVHIHTQGDYFGLKYYLICYSRLVVLIKRNFSVSIISFLLLFFNSQVIFCCCHQEVWLLCLLY